MLQIKKDEKEYKRSKPRVGSVEEDAADVGFLSEEERFDSIDYDNVHLSFDPEKSPKFNCSTFYMYELLYFTFVIYGY